MELNDHSTGKKAVTADVTNAKCIGDFQCLACCEAKKRRFGSMHARQQQQQREMSRSENDDGRNILAIFPRSRSVAVPWLPIHTHPIPPLRKKPSNSPSLVRFTFCAGYWKRVSRASPKLLPVAQDSPSANNRQCSWDRGSSGQSQPLMGPSRASS